MTTDLGTGAADAQFGPLQAIGADPETLRRFRPYEPLIAGWLAIATDDPALAAQLSAEVFATASLAGGGGIDAPRASAAWLLGIARNRLLRSTRRREPVTPGLETLGIRRLEPSSTLVATVASLGRCDPDVLVIGLRAVERNDAIRWLTNAGAHHDRVLNPGSRGRRVDLMLVIAAHAAIVLAGLVVLVLAGRLL